MATYKALVAAICTLYMTNLLLVAEAQSSSTLTYTLLKLHTFKTKAELCKNQYGSTRLRVRQNSTLEFNLAPNCTLCGKLNMQQHLVRIHKAIVKFVQPIADVYAFETSDGSYPALKACVRDVQHVLLTLKILMEIQVPATITSKHREVTTNELQTKTKSYLMKMAEYANKQPTKKEIMSELSVALMRELFVTSIVLQKDRAEMQKLASANGNQVI